MTYHHRAVILLGGWLLMMPPGEKSPSGEITVLTAAPLSRWMQISAHDTARECETAMGKELELEFLAGTSGDRADAKTSAIRRTLLYQAKCIPADHVYPPATPSK